MRGKEESLMLKELKTMITQLNRYYQTYSEKDKTAKKTEMEKADPYKQRKDKLDGRKKIK